MIPNSAHAWVRLLRPSQWLKNLMLFFPAFLGGILFDEGVVSRGLLPFIAFCLASSSTYIINDINDRHNDSNHPVKRGRPVASGQIAVGAAMCGSARLVAASIALANAVSFAFCLLLIAYLVVQALYSIKLKQMPIIDICCISAGFLIRLEAGGVVFAIPISEWLFLSVFLLAVFLSTGKRLGELKFLGEKAGEHRKSLDSYPQGFLEGVMYMTGGSVLVTYTMFVISRSSLLLTVPLCCFGLIRYMFRVQNGGSGDPTEALIKDGPLLSISIVWAFMVWYGYYGTYVR